MTLYEMTQSAQTLYDLFESGEIDENVVNDTLEGMGANLKLEDYCKVVRQLKADSECIKAEIDRMKKKQSSLENSIKRLNSAIIAYLDVVGKTKEKAGIFTVSATKTKSVNIVDESALPKEFLIPQPSKVDKASIRKKLMANETVSGAELQINRSIQIK
jgi:hypothetical protein